MRATWRSQATRRPSWTGGRADTPGGRGGCRARAARAWPRVGGAASWPAACCAPARSGDPPPRRTGAAAAISPGQVGAQARAALSLKLVTRGEGAVRVARAQCATPTLACAPASHVHQRRARQRSTAGGAHATAAVHHAGRPRVAPGMAPMCFSWAVVEARLLQRSCLRVRALTTRVRRAARKGATQRRGGPAAPDTRLQMCCASAAAKAVARRRPAAHIEHHCLRPFAAQGHHTPQQIALGMRPLAQGRAPAAQGMLIGRPASAQPHASAARRPGRPRAPGAGGAARQWRAAAQGSQPLPYAAGGDDAAERDAWRREVRAACLHCCAPACSAARACAAARTLAPIDVQHRAPPPPSHAQFRRRTFTFMGPALIVPMGEPLMCAAARARVYARARVCARA